MRNNILLVVILNFFLFVQCNSPTKYYSVTKKINLKDSCSIKNRVVNSTTLSNTSEITCPNCNYKTIETLPTDICVIKYTCLKCKTELTPKTGDCCVYCTYGSHKCPSKQYN